MSDILIRVDTASLRSATRKAYERPISGVGRDLRWSTALKHRCLHNDSGKLVKIQLIDGRDTRTIQCIASALVDNDGFSVFASEVWMFQCVGGGEVSVKMCKCCASQYFQGNANLDRGHTTISGKLQTQWAEHTIRLPANNSETRLVGVAGSIRMLENYVAAGDLVIGYEAFDNPNDVVQEIDQLRQGGVAFRASFGDGGTSSGLEWSETRQLILGKQNIGEWLRKKTNELTRRGDSIKSGYMTSYESERSNLGWHADLDYLNSWFRLIQTIGGDGSKRMFVMDRREGEWFGLKIVHGMFVIMSRRLGGPNDRAMMHVVPNGGKAKFIALEFGRRGRI